MSTDTRRPRWLTPRCVVCAIEPGAPLCAGCEADFFSPLAIRCPRCAVRLETAALMCGHCIAQPRAFDATRALADYVAPVSGMVSALKFAARLDLADVFARLFTAREPLPREADLVIAVPLSYERESERGFNQSREIARGFARLSGLPLRDGLLLRTVHAVPQQSLARDARQRNVRGAFALVGDVRGQRVAVVDDVMTTGSTLDEIAAVLKRAGAVQVVNRVVARTP
jgi:ComF family protein